MRQDASWRKWLELLRKEPCWDTASPHTKDFVSFFDQRLKDKLGSGSAGNRQRVTSAFTDGIVKLLKQNMVEVDRKPKRIALGGGTKAVDISFTLGKKTWLVEVKTGLEFNSLGAAALEALAFKQADPDCVFVLLALYSKFGARTIAYADGSSVNHVLHILNICGIDPFDRVVVLSENAHSDDEWYAGFVKEMDAFFHEILGNEENIA